MADPMKILFIMTAFAIIYMFQGSQAGFGAAIVFYFFANGIWNRLGAWPEAWYRVRGITYRQFYIFLPNRRIGRYLKTESQLKIGSAARAQIEIAKDKTGEYFIPSQGDEMFANPHGAPASLHNWDDSRAIPVFGREPYATEADGTLVPKAKVDPFLVHAAFKNDVHERRHTLNVKPGKLKWGIFGFLIALSVMLSFAAVYYTVLYGINMNCALHTKACP